MSEIIRSEGDALAKLIQLTLRRYDLKLPTTNKGTEDLDQLVRALAVKTTLSQHLWGAMHELVRMPEVEQLPEAIRVKIIATVLNAQTLTDLDTEAQAAKRAVLAAARKG